MSDAASPGILGSPIIALLFIKIRVNGAKFIEQSVLVSWNLTPSLLSVNIHAAYS